MEGRVNDSPRIGQASALTNDTPAQKYCSLTLDANMLRVPLNAARSTTTRRAQPADALSRRAIFSCAGFVGFAGSWTAPAPSPELNPKKLRPRYDRIGPVPTATIP